MVKWQKNITHVHVEQESTNSANDDADDDDKSINIISSWTEPKRNTNDIEHKQPKNTHTFCSHFAVSRLFASLNVVDAIITRKEMKPTCDASASAFNDATAHIHTNAHTYTHAEHQKPTKKNEMK